MSTTYILLGGNAGVASLVQQASTWPDPVVAVVVGPRELAERAAAPGVDRVLWLGDLGHRPVEAFAPSVAAVVADAGVVLAGRRPAERALLGAAAAALRAPVVAGASDVVHEAGATVVTHGLYGGIAVATSVFNGPVCLVLDGGAVLAGGGPASVEQVEAAPYPMTVEELRPDDTSQVELGAAAVVVGVGRGLRAREDLALIEELARALGAEVACSRPLAEGLGWMSRDRYIGTSGQHIAPALYLAVGISGQLQHMSGVRDAGTVVSINTDKNAPVVPESDYVLTGDLYQLVPAITAALG